MTEIIAKKFDKQVSRFENLRARDKFASLRKDLLQNISGSILEIAPGPGFNFVHYQHIESLTAMDISPKMLDSAKTYWQSVGSVPADFVVGDIATAVFPDQSFDAIVSTCSLCAYEDPILVLNNLARWCKPTGQIYLLEHGLSDNPMVRTLQKSFDPIHYKIHTCHCNRDIASIVQPADLEIVSIDRPRQYAVIDFIYTIIARPKP